MQTPSSTCPRCQSPIPTDAPGGLCPSCALLGVAEPTNLSQAAAANAPTIDEVAAAFPDLEVLELIGQGGMGVVFKARQPRLDRFVALKILPPALAAQPGFAERFTREARVLARLAHPHIVAIFDFGESAGFFYLIMEFVNGVNLRAAMRAGVQPEQALLLVPHICEALQFAHDHGVLHRDIKPENILLDTTGTPKLADFGIAKLAGEESMKTGLTATGAALGTVAYMSPEQIEKPATVDHRADIYSLGVVLYEMLTGELPLGRFAAPSEKSSVGCGVDEVVMRSLEKERERRQQSANEMKTQVEQATSGGGSQVAPPMAPLPVRELRWSRAAAWGAALVAASVPLGLLFYLIVWQVVIPAYDVQGQLAGPIAGNIIIFGFVPALLGTLLGWKAVGDLRYHRGHLRGGGTAVFAALAVPLLTLLTTVVVNFQDIDRAISPGRQNPEGAIMASLVVIAALAASVWSVRALWHFVHAGPAGVPVPPRPPSPATTSDPLVTRILIALTALSAIGIPVTGMMDWSSPNPVHMVALTIVFGTLIGLSRAFAPQARPTPQAQSAPLHPRAPQTFTEPMHEKDLGLAYLFWFLFGFLGGHKFYLGKVGWGLLYFFTGGLLFVGWFIDLFTLPAQVRSHNEALRALPPGGFRPPGTAPDPWPKYLFLLLLAPLAIVALMMMLMGVGIVVPMVFARTATHRAHPTQVSMEAALASDEAPSWRTTQGEQPHSTSLGDNFHSAYLLRSDRALGFVLWRAGSFKSVSDLGRYESPGDGTWTDDVRAELPNGTVLNFSRTSAEPFHLVVGPDRFDLRKGRVFIIGDDGSVLQRPIQTVKLRDPLDLPAFAARLAQPEP